MRALTASVRGVIARHPFMVALSFAALLLGLLVWCCLGTVRLYTCNAYHTVGGRTECAYSVVEEAMRAQGTGEAMKLWSEARRVVRNFSDEACHSASHRVGDMAYYHFYVADTDSVRFTYPFESTVCDYGFYHGFYEHLFQDHPDPAFVIKTCDALPMGPEPYKAVIRMTCFHGSGHGFVLAMADIVSPQKFGDVHAFTDKPLQFCDQMKGVTTLEHGRCVYGIFAEIAQFQYLNNYGFSFATSTKDRFSLCGAFAGDTRDKCARVTAIVSVSEFGAQNTLEACQALQGASSFAACTQGVVLGLYIDAATPKEFQQGLDLCASGAVAKGQATAACYQQIAVVIHAYYASDDTVRLCRMLPERYQPGCLIGSPSPAEH